jgi:hypothetical protein
MPRVLATASARIALAAQAHHALQDLDADPAQEQADGQTSGAPGKA